MKISN
jgi:hypothetical protein